MARAVSTQHSAVRKSKNKTKTRELPPLSERSPRMRFPEVQGKTLEWVELWIEEHDDSYLELRFPDQTSLVFVLKPRAGIDVEASLGAWRKGNWRKVRDY